MGKGEGKGGKKVTLLTAAREPPWKPLKKPPRRHLASSCTTVPAVTTLLCTTCRT